MDQGKPLTRSQALIKLGIINSIENAIDVGIFGFSRAQHFSELSNETRTIMVYELTHFNLFCETFEKVVVRDETGNDKAFEQWLLKKKDKGDNKKLEMYLAVNTGYSSIDQRKLKIADVRFLHQAAKNAVQGKLSKADCARALDLLEIMRAEISEKLAGRKREAERGISGLPPGI